MPKLFIISDIHSFYDEMIMALDKAGFDKEDPNHWLICCGDYFDRGNKPLEVMNYLMSLPRKILIKGNHETLMENLLKRGYSEYYDAYNGTSQTVDLLSERNKNKYTIVYEKIKDFYDEMVDYAETQNYIFVHSWIPGGNDWRQASREEWESARWENPFRNAWGRLLPNKTIVFGHYHTSYPRHVLSGEPEWEDGADFSIYYGEGFIGIDGCIAASKVCNVLILEDKFLK